MSMKSEKYTSKKAMIKHEKGEGKSERKMEYGSAKKGIFFTKASGAKAKKAVAKKAVAKRSMVRKKGM